MAPLHLAADYGHVEVVEKLIMSKANIYATYKVSGFKTSFIMLHCNDFYMRRMSGAVYM